MVALLPAARTRLDRFAEIAAEFVQRKVDVTVTSSTVGVVATKQATSIIPIVFVAGDPVGTGLVASLARPGGNATGLSLQQTETNGKRFELLREVVPGLSRLAILSAVLPSCWTCAAFRQRPAYMALRSSH
jgi:putative tryptophan/tyrosine transport system substrate-binding protein